MPAARPGQRIWCSKCVRQCIDEIRSERPAARPDVRRRERSTGLLPPVPEDRSEIGYRGMDEKGFGNAGRGAPRAVRGLHSSCDTHAMPLESQPTPVTVTLTSRRQLSKEWEAVRLQRGGHGHDTPLARPGDAPYNLPNGPDYPDPLTQLPERDLRRNSGMRPSDPRASLNTAF